jgi:hypothetical protein
VNLKNSRQGRPRQDKTRQKGKSKARKGKKRQRKRREDKKYGHDPLCKGINFGEKLPALVDKNEVVYRQGKARPDT